MADYEDYKITHRRFRKGGSGYIHKAQDSQGRTVALKVPIIAFSEETMTEKVRTAYTREAKTWKQICDRGILGIVEIYDFGIYEGVPWIAMEFMEGGNLGRWMKKANFDEKLEMMKKLLKSLAMVHHVGVIHRDIKPENILLSKENEPKIADWGLGKVLLTAMDHTSEFKGSFFYAAPEQFKVRKFGKADWRTDVYQFGAMCYEMFTARKVFPVKDKLEIMNCILQEEPKAPSKLNSELPHFLDPLLLRCLKKGKKERFQSLDVLLYELEEVVPYKRRYLESRKGLKKQMLKLDHQRSDTEKKEKTNRGKLRSQREELKKKEEKLKKIETNYKMIQKDFLRSEDGWRQELESAAKEKRSFQERIDTLEENLEVLKKEARERRTRYNSLIRTSKVEQKKWAVNLNETLALNVSLEKQVQWLKKEKESQAVEIGKLNSELRELTARKKELFRKLEEREARSREIGKSTDSIPEKFCKQCGNVLGADADFCGFCGTRQNLSPEL